MTRRLDHWALAVALVVGACRGRGSSADVPTVEVERTPSFVRVVSAEGTLRAVEATPLLAPQDSERPMKIGWVAQDGTRVKKGDVVVRFDSTDAERLLADSKADVDTAKRQISKENVEGAVARKKRNATADLADVETAVAEEFESDDEDILSRNEIIESTIDVELARAKAEHARKVKAIEGAVTSSKIDLYDIAKDQASREVQRAEQALDKLQVTAPHDGILVLTRNWRDETIRAGDTVWKGQKLAELPDAKAMEAELYVLEADAGNLVEGLAAELVIASRPGITYHGKVEHVDTLAQPRHPEVPVHYFGVTVSVEHDEDDELSVGARVHAEIRIEQSDVIVVPRQAVFDVDGKPTVYRASGSDFEAVPVKLGTSSPGRIVIDEGIEPGDRVALRDPAKDPDELINAGRDTSSLEESPPGGAP